MLIETNMPSNGCGLELACIWQGQSASNMNNQLDRAHHTFFCLAAFVCWYVLSYAALLIPGYSSLYQSGLAVVVMHLCLLLPCALIFGISIQSATSFYLWDG